MRIFRYQVPVDDAAHSITLTGEIVSVDGRRVDIVGFWAVHNDDGVSRIRWFQVVGTGTGHELPKDFVRVIGTVVHGALVWHLIEVQERL